MSAKVILAINEVTLKKYKLITIRRFESGML